MPELPEVEVLVRCLQPLVAGRTIHAVEVHRKKVVRPTACHLLVRALTGARIVALERRAKYLVFRLCLQSGADRFLLGHLGMTGRMYLLPEGQPLPRHRAVVLHLDKGRFVYEDPRCFGRFTLDTTPLEGLGPEPLAPAFTSRVFARVLACSAQAIKVRLLDQAVLAGIGNIYASESLFQAGIAPDRPARSLQPQEVRALRRALRQVLRQAIRSGSSVPLDWLGTGPGDGFFYYGQSPGRGASRTERFRVYDRAGQPCLVCGSAIRRTVQSSRSTFSCPSCQPSRNAASPGRSPGTARLDRGLTA